MTETLIFWMLTCRASIGAFKYRVCYRFKLLFKHKQFNFVLFALRLCLKNEFLACNARATVGDFEYGVRTIS